LPEAAVRTGIVDRRGLRDARSGFQAVQVTFHSCRRPMQTSSVRVLHFGGAHNLVNIIRYRWL